MYMGFGYVKDGEIIFDEYSENSGIAGIVRELINDPQLIHETVSQRPIKPQMKQRVVIDGNGGDKWLWFWGDEEVADEMGTFGEVELKPSGKYRLTLDGRYDEEEVKAYLLSFND